MKNEVAELLKGQRIKNTIVLSRSAIGSDRTESNYKKQCPSYPIRKNWRGVSDVSFFKKKLDTVTIGKLKSKASNGS